MRKLNKNYTTLEQSKKLLRLGVPANSADCYYVDDDETPKFRETDLFFSPKGKVNDGYSEYEVTYTPCWTVGRLMEIYGICADEYRLKYEPYYTWRKRDLIGTIINSMEHEIENGNGFWGEFDIIDFSDLDKEDEQEKEK